MISVVIPAHNEATVIGQCLDPLDGFASEGLAEVVVVCNGCKDGTADIVRKEFPQITCLEADNPSKTNALNLGDQAVSSFPRFYVDADVVLPRESVQRITEVLQKDSFLAAAPRFKMDFTGSSWAVRAYYDIWQRLPYVNKGMIGTGVYALSEEGRKRFDTFPDIIADDGYVRALFKEHERTVVDDCEVIVRAPRSLKDLLKIKTRSRLGGYELFHKFPVLKANEEKNYGSVFKQFLPKLSLWPRLFVYLYVNFVARARAKKKFRDMESFVWERDESARTGSANG